MNNKIKLVILLLLVATIGVELYLLWDTNRKIDELKATKKENNTTNEEVPYVPPVVPMLTMNSEINKILNVFSYKDSIIDRAVTVASEFLDKQVQQGINLTDATVSDIKYIDLSAEKEHDSIDMFNVEMMLTKVDGEKIIDNSMYLIFYNRWDEDEQNNYFITCITENTMDQKYSALSEEYGGNVYTTACAYEKMAYLKRGEIIADENLESSAYEKAAAFAKYKGINDVVFDKYTVSFDDNVKKYSFGNAMDDTVITVAYTYFDDISGWAFLYADM